jgi:hypothetical protein
MEKDGFKSFKITVPENKRYWEDDTTGVVVKRGQVVEINQRDFRSSELKSALLRNWVLIVEGECEFVYKENIVKMTKGEDGNKREIISGPEYEETKKEEIEKIKKPDKNKKPKNEIDEVKSILRGDEDKKIEGEE